MTHTPKRIGAGAVPGKAVDLDALIDLIFDLFDLLDLVIDVLRNLGNYLSGI